MWIGSLFSLPLHSSAHKGPALTEACGWSVEAPVDTWLTWLCEATPSYPCALLAPAPAYGPVSSRQRSFPLP